MPSRAMSLERTCGDRPGVAGAADRRAHAQAGPAVRLVEEQHLAREDQVRVADLLEVHAPELGPAPRALQVQPGDAPERVAALDGVDVGRVRQQLAQRHAGFGGLLRRRALLRRDREVGLGGERARPRASSRAPSDGELPKCGRCRENSSAHAGSLVAARRAPTRSVRKVFRGARGCLQRGSAKISLGFTDSAHKALISQRKWAARSLVRATFLTTFRCAASTFAAALNRIVTNEPTRHPSLPRSAPAHGRPAGGGGRRSHPPARRRHARDDVRRRRRRPGRDAGRRARARHRHRHLRGARRADRPHQPRADRQERGDDARRRRLPVGARDLRQGAAPRARSRARARSRRRGARVRRPRGCSRSPCSTRWITCSARSSSST